jgi:hypothetical protein
MIHPSMEYEALRVFYQLDQRGQVNASKARQTRRTLMLLSLSKR